ncbi:hypothetical protein PICMEDRAFT_14861 [Pichia membranifaciens NRRL Y-2026]|uniref:B30.2/SPRY domain-containing protein n=1 Tax=Pichia membranifaciens NRRL Y-2026 TaxID=763406 RepID=A0A1E3NTB8_9ASCO|nr:hypothetical protein PICMEDRAFT_14861 [Pichia membranifaciens NRRL Y-2026]ODQ49397.1 hypothetical protein PICMEDRAFT_14861 [Pichia membranifaciens NRRL Y-2026]
MPFVHPRSQVIDGYGPSEDIGDGGDSPLVPFLLISISFLLMLVMLLTVALIQRCCGSRGGELSDDTEESDLQYDDATEIENDASALRTMSPDEQEIYFQAKEYIKLNGFARMDLAPWQKDMIKEKGVHAWSLDTLSDNQHSVTVENKTEITFNNRNIPISVQSNLPIPFTKDVHYIEFKIFDIPERFRGNTLISLSLSTFPYPSFVLPGRYLHSLAYDSNGDRRHNNPFLLEDLKAGHDIFPTLEEGDVVGIGIKKYSRAVFFTRNGKKLSESKIGGHVKLPRSVQLYPTVGSINPCRIDVNFGQMGFVFIEANVKKWALAPLRGSEVPPPLYTKFNHDVLLDCSDVEDSELPEFEDVVHSGMVRPAEFTDDERGDDEVTLDTIEQPPNYDHLIQDEIREAMGENIDDPDP